MLPACGRLRHRVIRLLLSLAYTLLASTVPGTSTGSSLSVVLARYEGVINPVAAEYVHDVLSFAEQEQAQAFILRLDTPGGLDTSMRSIVKDFTMARVPVVVFVSPSGARAASAGVFLTMAAHVGAMAPGTNIGAAHPVALGGEMDKTMKEKAENDAAAYLKSIAEQHARNVRWAEDAVRKSVSATEKEALKLNIIDLIAADVPMLLQDLDGRRIVLASGPVILKTKGATTREFELGWRLEMLKALSDPNVAYLLMTLGMIGLLAELYNPGAILPGIVGGISLILAFYAFQSLPISYAGVLLLLFGLVLFILEATVTSFGLLAIGGVLSMLLGSLMLIKTDAPFLQLSFSVILPVVVVFTLGALLIVTAGIRAIRRQPLTGQEGMIGLTGIARTTLNPQGRVFVRGELWEAASNEPVQPGEAVVVTSVEGLRLRVKPFARKDAPA